MSTINEVVSDGLRNAGLSHYSGQASTIVRALEAREAEAVDALVAYAVQAGLSAEDAKDAISEAGLTVPATPEETTPASDDDRLARMERNIDALMEVARSRGLLR